MSEQLVLNLRLRDSATFANYVGELADRVATLTGLALLTGTPGSGRSHLLQGLCHARQPSMYIADPGRHDPQILGSLAEVGTVCIDDVDRVLGDEGWELALLSLVHAIANHGGTLLLATADVPQHLNIQLPDLASRLRGASLLRTEALSDVEQRSLLQRTAARRGFDMPVAVAEFILRRSRRDTGSLIDQLDQLDQQSLREQRVMSIPFARQVLDL